MVKCKKLARNLSTHKLAWYLQFFVCITGNLFVAATFRSREAGRNPMHFRFKLRLHAHLSNS